MSASNYVHLDVQRILKETDRAFLLLLDDDEELWVPKSVISDEGDYNEGDANCTISIQQWFADKEGIES